MEEMHIHGYVFYRHRQTQGLPAGRSPQIHVVGWVRGATQSPLAGQTPGVGCHLPPLWKPCPSSKLVDTCRSIVGPLPPSAAEPFVTFSYTYITNSQLRVSQTMVFAFAQLHHFIRNPNFFSPISSGDVAWMIPAGTGRPNRNTLQSTSVD